MPITCLLARFFQGGDGTLRGADDALATHFLEIWGRNGYVSRMIRGTRARPRTRCPNSARAPAAPRQLAGDRRATPAPSPDFLEAEPRRAACARTPACCRPASLVPLGSPRCSAAAANAPPVAGGLGRPKKAQRCLGGAEQGYGSGPAWHVALLDRNRAGRGGSAISEAGRRLAGARGRCRAAARCRVASTAPPSRG